MGDISTSLRFAQYHKGMYFCHPDEGRISSIRLKFKENRNKTKKDMKTDFLDFYHNLEKDQRFEVIEFRLQYKKKLHKYIAFQCPVMAADLKELQKRYFQRANPQISSSANKQKNKNR